MAKSKCRTAKGHIKRGCRFVGGRLVKRKAKRKTKRYAKTRRISSYKTRAYPKTQAMWR